MIWRYSAGRRGPAFMLALVLSLGVLSVAEFAHAGRIKVYTYHIDGSNRIEGAEVCVKVIEGTTPNGQDTDVVFQINQIRSVTNAQGVATMHVPREFYGEDPGMFSGEVRFTAYADGYCPMACDVQFLYNTPEIWTCFLNLNRVDPDNIYSCSQGISTPTVAGPGPQIYVRNENDEIVPVEDGVAQIHYGFGLTCDPTQRPIEVMPGVPERVMPEMPAERVLPDTVDPRVADPRVVDPRRDPRVVDPGRVRPPSR